jgi:hypothetical protein
MGLGATALSCIVFQYCIGTSIGWLFNSTKCGFHRGLEPADQKLQELVLNVRSFPYGEKKRRESRTAGLPILTETRGKTGIYRRQWSPHGGILCAKQGSMYSNNERRCVGSNESKEQVKRKSQLRQGNRKEEAGL